MAQAREAPSAKDPLDTILFESPVVEIGKFRVWPTHPRFHDSGPIERNILVFPRVLVRIAHEGEEGFVAGPELVTYYNQGQVYRRDSVNGSPDRCEWFAFSPDVLSDALASLDPLSAEQTMAPFRFSYGPGDPRCYLRQRRIVDALSADPKLDPMEVEEESMGVLADLLSRAYREHGEGWFSATSPADSSRKRDRSLAEDAKVAVGKIFRHHVPLSEIAASLGVSVFRLCRAFRRATGSTLHGFRNRLRLAASLERIGRRSFDLTDIALDLGYSSHSHFTAAFRREFGVTPSAFRRRSLPQRADSSAPRPEIGGRRGSEGA